MAEKYAAPPVSSLTSSTSSSLLKSMSGFLSGAAHKEVEEKVMVSEDGDIMHIIYCACVCVCVFVFVHIVYIYSTYIYHSMHVMCTITSHEVQKISYV